MQDKLFELYKKAKAIANKLIEYERPKYATIGDQSDGCYAIDYILPPRREIEIIETDHEKDIAVEGVLAFYYEPRMLIVNTQAMTTLVLDESAVIGLFIGEKLKKIENEILLQDLRYLYVVSKNEHYYADNNVLYTKDRTRLIAYASRKPEEVYEADDNLKVISSYAFLGAKNLKKLIIGKDVDIRFAQISDKIEIIRK